MALCGPSAFVMYVPGISSESAAFIFKKGPSILKAEGKTCLRNVGKHLPSDTTPTIPEFKRHLYRVSQEEWTKLRESVPYVKIYRYNPKHLYPKLNGYGDNGQISLKV